MNAEGRQNKIDDVFKPKVKDGFTKNARIAIGSIWEKSLILFKNIFVCMYINI